MIDSFNSGLLLGAFFIFAIFLLFFGILFFLENGRKNKYLIEINSLDKYEKWKKNGGN